MSIRITDATLERLCDLIDIDKCDVDTYLSQQKEIVAEINADDLRSKSMVFKALGDETRLKIIHLLKRRDMCVCELIVALNTAQPTMSHHLKVLENARLIKRMKKGKWVFYGLKDEDSWFSIANLSQNTTQKTS